ncbi:MAG TPA: conjugal transfer protein TraF [Oligoflexus sp.]|uniref:conjugal transfer protein TraF n=1 Tax=Oligoflexus sp. TaxID=1971216 RepID=UPI002D2A998F|nr:conjugal transfer protein TraF [Oligoflexus sp.]HYX33080.1 conjugal transfer protein TraF [Oligoflexus sp.]
MIPSRLYRACLSLVLSGSAGHLYADSLEFHRIYRSAYFLGRGDTGVATADYHEAIFYNPAGLAKGKGLYKETVLISPTVQVSTKTKDLVRQVLVQEDNDPDTLRGYLGRNLHLGVSNFTGVVFRRAALGILASSDTNVMLAKSADERGLETLHADAVANRVAVFSAAEDFFNQKLLVGITGKYIMRNEATLDVSALDSDNISDQLSSNDAEISRNGIGVDLGLMYDMDKKPWRFGLHVENLGTTKLAAGESGVSSKRLPQIVTLGAAYDLTTKMSSLVVQADFRDVGGAVEKDTFKRLHLGTELQFARVFGFMGGLNQGYPTVGLFLNLYVARLDIGAYTEEVGSTAGVRPDQRLFFRLKAGF